MKFKQLSASLLSLSFLILFINAYPINKGDLNYSAAYPPLEGSQTSMFSISSRTPLSSEPEEASQQGALTAPTGLAALWPFQQSRTPAYRERLSPHFEKFINQVKNGVPDQVRGVYVANSFALPVIQQPEDEPAFVSENLGEVTQFRSAAENGITGLLAHNYLSGQEFYELDLGEDVNIVYGNGMYRRYRVTEIRRFQKLTPNSLHSDFIDLESGKKETTAQVFNRFYNGKHKVTFQTCLENEGLSNWGLIFIVAEAVR